MAEENAKASDDPLAMTAAVEPAAEDALQAETRHERSRRRLAIAAGGCDVGSEARLRPQ